MIKGIIFMVKHVDVVFIKMYRYDNLKFVWYLDLKNKSFGINCFQV